MANSLSDLFSKDSPLTQIASSYATGLANAGSKPKPIIIQQAAAAPSSSSNDSNKMLYIGGAFLVVIIAIFSLKRRG